MMMNVKRSKRNEEREREVAKRSNLISKARRGDAKAAAELKNNHGITRVWTKEEIEAYEQG
jgi:hypothetical protein